MYNASEQLNEAIRGNRRKLLARIKAGEKEITDGFKSIRSTMRSCSSDSITIGGAVSAYTEIEMWKPDFELENTEVEISIGLQLESAVEWVPLGLYTIQKPQNDDGLIKFTAYDRIQSKMSGAYFSKLSYPADGKTVLREISSMTGVPIDTSNLADGVLIPKRMVISEAGFDSSGNAVTNTTFEEPFNGYSYRDALGYVAMLYCKFAMADRTGTVVFRWYKQTDYVIGPDRYYDDLVTSELVFFAQTISCRAWNTTFTAGTGEKTIELENPVMTQEQLNAIYAQIKDLRFLPAGLSFYGDVCVDVGDFITVNDKYGNIVKIPVMSIVQEFDGGLSTKIQSYGGTQAGNTTKGPTLQRLDRTYMELFLVKELIGSKASFDYVYSIDGEFKNLKSDYGSYKTLVSNEFAAVNGQITNLSGDFASFKTGEFATLQAKQANFETVTSQSVTTVNGRIDTLTGDFADYKKVIAQDFTATNGQIDTLTGEYASFKEQTVEKLTADRADIEHLKTTTLELDNLIAKKADITELNATNAQIDNLSGQFSSFQTSMSQEMITAKGWMLEGAIGDAQISKVSANKLGAGTIDTAIVTVAGTDGRLQIQDNTIQIKDTTRVRVQIGKDAGGDYSMSVWDASGQLIWDALGATENTIQRKIIRDRMVADDAAIQALKIDFQSFDTALTQQGVTISGTVVQVGSKTLNVALSEQTQLITEHGETLTDHATRITASENDIRLKVSTQDFNSYKTTVNGELTSAKSRLSTAESSITAMQGQIALKVEQTDIDSAVENLHIGGRNYFSSKTKVSFNSANEFVLNTYQNVGSFTQFYNLTIPISNFVGKKCILSFDIVSPNGSTPLRIYNSNGGPRYLISVSGIKSPVGSTWMHQEVVIQVMDLGSGKSEAQSNKIEIYCPDQKGCKIRNVKFEIGTKATDWTPAPEDIDASITAVDNKFANYSTTTQMQSAINLAKDSITSTVSKTYATQTYADGIKATADSAKKEVYAAFSGNGDSKAYCLLCQIKISRSYINTPTVIEINQRGYGYSLCEIKFASSTSTDPALYSIRKTGTPQWRIVKSATSTWDVYVKKSESWDNITVVGFTKGTVPSVTWICMNAELPNGSIAATQLAGLYTVDSTSGGTAGSDALITSGAAHSAISPVQTIATQTAEKFNWIVKSGTSATDFTLTDRTAQLITEKLTIKDSTGASTIISGGKMDINKIFAQDITANGTIRGVTLEGVKGKIANFTVQDTVLYGGNIAIYNGSSLNGGYVSIGGSEYTRCEVNYRGTGVIFNDKVTGNAFTALRVQDVGMSDTDPGMYTDLTLGFIKFQSGEVVNTISANGRTGVIKAKNIELSDPINVSAIELSSAYPFIDFHFGNHEADYTTRIIEHQLGQLSFEGVNQTPVAINGKTSGESSIRYYYNGDYNNAWVVGPGAGTADMNKFGFYHCPTSATKAYINYNGEIVSLLGGLSQFRAVNGGYGFMIRNDGANTYFLLTANGDPYGGWRDTFPFVINNSNGLITNRTGIYFPTDVGVQSSTGYILRTFNASNYSNLTGIGNTSSQASIYTSNRVWKNGSTSTYFSTTSSSDKRLKETAGDMASYESFFEALRPVPFKYHEGLYDAPNRSPKIQWGFYAQDVIQAFERNGINWHDQELVVVEDGDLTAEELKYVQPGTLLKMNYQNLTALNTHMIQKHSRDISRIEYRQESEQYLLNTLQNTVAELQAEINRLRLIVEAA